MDEIQGISTKSFRALLTRFTRLEFTLRNNSSVYMMLNPFSKKQKEMIINSIKQMID